jgi:hypothetical protein
VVLGSYVRTSLLINRDGENEDVYWRPSDNIALTTKGGRIYFLDINRDEQGEDLLKNPMDVADGISHRLNSKHHIRLVLRGTFLVSNTGIAWMYETPSKMHTCTHDGYLQRWTPTRDQFHLDEELPLYALSQVSLRILMTSKSHKRDDSSEKSGAQSHSAQSGGTGDQSTQGATSPEPNEFYNAIDDFMEDLAVTSICFSPILKTMLVSFQGGRAAVLTGNLESTLTEMKLYWLPLTGATVVAINERKRLLTVGTDSGDISLFNAGPGFKFQRQLSLNPWGITKKITGAAKTLEWSPDGRVLAVGFAARGIVTWTSYGCRLNCTISEFNVMNEEHQLRLATTRSTTASRRSKSKEKVNSVRFAVPPSPRTSSAPPQTPTTQKQTSPKASQKSERASQPEAPTPSSSFQSAQHDPTPLKSSQTTEGAIHGVASMCWGDGGYTLMVSSNHISQCGVFDQYQFVKASIAANMNLSSCQKIILQGADRILILATRGKDLNELAWKHFSLPIVYSQDNWPIRHVSVSPDGGYIAVAGQKGFVLQNVATGAWSLFGDRMEEQAISCISIAWFRNLLVTAVYNETMKTHQVTFFSRDVKLAFSSVIFRANVPQNQTPTFLDCNDASLVLFTTNAYYQYKILIDGENAASQLSIRSGAQLSLKLTHQLGIDHPFDVTSVLLLPSSVVFTDGNEAVPSSSYASPEHQSPQSGKPSSSSTSDSSAMPRETGSRVSKSMAKMLVLDSSGDLSLTNAERTINIVLSKGIEQFWMASSDIVNDLGNSLWAFGERGLEVWFPFFTHSVQESQKQNYLTRERSLDFDPEVCPIGFLTMFGLIVGISQGPTRAYSTNAPCFSYEAKTQPFLHSVLKRMLEKGETEHAVSIAKRYSSIAHFQHTLELLLHEALEVQYHADHKRKQQRASNTNGGSLSVSKSLADDLSEAASESSSVASEVTDEVGKVRSETEALLMRPPSMQTIGKSPSFSLSSSAASVAKSQAKTKSKEKPKVLLRYVFEFLREFGVQLYTMVVVACARKVDPVLWPTLFHPKYTAGKPRALFEQCLVTGQLHVASSYLRVIQYMEGEGESRRAALQCLDLCLKLDNLELLRDLMRFLEPETSTPSAKTTPAPEGLSSEPAPTRATGSEPTHETVKLRKEVEAHTTGGFSEQEEQFILDDTMSRYIRKLLTLQDLRGLVRFSRITRHGLSKFLSREKKRAAIVEDYSRALGRLHSDFGIPRPTHFPINHLYFDAKHAMKDYSAIYFPNSDVLLRQSPREVSLYSLRASDSSSDDSDSSDTQTSSEADNSASGDVRFPHDDMDWVDDSWQDSSIKSSFRDLEFLLHEMASADCAGWTLIIATILFRVPLIISVLEKHPIFWKVYKPMLSSESCQGYTELLAHLLKHVKM